MMAVDVILVGAAVGAVLVLVVVLHPELTMLLLRLTVTVTMKVTYLLQQIVIYTMIMSTAVDAVVVV